MTGDRITRLVDDPEAPPSVAELIAAGRDEAPTDEQMAGLLRRLDELAVGPTPAAAGLTLRRVAVPLAASLAAAVVIYVAVTRGGASDAGGEPASRPPAASAQPAIETAAERADDRESPPAGSGAERAPAPVEAPVVHKRRGEAPGRERARPSLPTEVELIRGARTALAAGDYDEALAATGEHIARFADGVLTEEREALAIEALVQLGRGTDAQSRFARFVAGYPQSSYRQRLGRLVGRAR